MCVCAVSRLRAAAADDVKRMRWKWNLWYADAFASRHANTCSSMCDPGGLQRTIHTQAHTHKCEFDRRASAIDTERCESV